MSLRYKGSNYNRKHCHKYEITLFYSFVKEQRNAGKCGLLFRAEGGTEAARLFIVMCGVFCYVE